MTTRQTRKWWNRLWIVIGSAALTLACFALVREWRSHPPAPQTAGMDDSCQVITRLAWTRAPRDFVVAQDTIKPQVFPKPLDVARVREIVQEELRKHDSACAARVQGVWVPTELDHFPGAVPDTAWAWRKR